MQKLHVNNFGWKKFRPVIFAIAVLALWVTPSYSFAGQAIYTFTSTAPSTGNTSVATAYTPTNISLGIESDFDTLDITTQFLSPLTSDRFLPQSIAGLQGGTVTPTLTIAISPLNFNSSIFGVPNGSINISTTQNVYSFDVPQPASVSVSNQPFGNGTAITSCSVTSSISTVQKQNLVFTLPHNCLQLSAQFLVQAQVKFVSTSGSIIYSTLTPSSPMEVDLTQVAGFKLPQIINFQPIQSPYLSQGSINLSATDNSGLPLKFNVQNSSNVCAVPNQTVPNVQLLGAGTCTIVATADGNNTYQAASSVTYSFQILTPQLDQSINQNFPTTLSLDNPEINFQTNSSSGEQVQVQSATPTICQITSQDTLDGENPGNCLINLTVPTNGNYKPEQSQVSILVTPAHVSQNVSYSAPLDVHVGGSGFDLDLTNDAGLPLKVVSDSPDVCTFNKSDDPLYVTIVGVGTCSMEVSQDGNDQYSPFYASGVTFQVLPAIASGSNSNSGSGAGSSGPSKVVITSSSTAPVGQSRADTQTNTAGLASSKITAATSQTASAGVKISAKSSPGSTNQTSSKVTKNATPKPSPKPSGKPTPKPSSRPTPKPSGKPTIKVTK
jgi:hypothetical protein